ncbi:MAG: hypothetical protein PHU21_14865 [Elusimicrobia bacterium]|jgi:hypothetical protein|nr:hypothetical protein [Elusimicrobiota bacterium]
MKMRTKNPTLAGLAVGLAILALSGCRRAGESFGAAISDRTLVPISSIVANPAAYAGKSATIAGRIVAECPSGCWFELQQDAAILHVDINPSGFAIPQKVGGDATVQGRIELEDGRPVLIGGGVELH